MKIIISILVCLCYSFFQHSRICAQSSEPVFLLGSGSNENGLKKVNTKHFDTTPDLQQGSLQLNFDDAFRIVLNNKVTKKRFKKAELNFSSQSLLNGKFIPITLNPSSMLHDDSQVLALHFFTGNVFLVKFKIAYYL